MLPVWALCSALIWPNSDTGKSRPIIPWTVPIPLAFAQGQFESGIAAKVLNEFAAEPYPYLDEAARKKMNTGQLDLLRKFQEIAFDESAKMRCEESQRAEADNSEGPAEATDLQNDLFESSGNPF